MRIRVDRRAAATAGGVCGLAAIVAAVIALGTPAHAASPEGGQLSGDGQRIVDYLIDDWRKQFRSTSIPLAMDNLGIAADDAVRLEVLAHLHANTDLANNLTYWGPNNYVFSNEEKRIAKYLIHMQEREARAATEGEATEALEVDEAVLRERLPFMAATGFLEESDDPLGFSLAPGYKRWAGPLQHNFHTVTIEGERPFDVW